LELKDTIMESSSKEQGICSTCVHLENCEHRRKTTGPIWFCEDFDDYVPEKAERKIKPAGTPPQPDPNDDKFMGLCVNCDHRFTCVNAKQPGGVWFCEEYI